MAFWTYILRCADGQYYTGHTEELERRVGEHKTGAIKGFTSSKLPVVLVWSEYFQTRLEAIEAELRIKKWSKAKKEALARGDWKTVSYFAKPPKERLSEPPGVSTSLDTNGERGSGPSGEVKSDTNGFESSISPQPFVSSAVETPISQNQSTAAKSTKCP
jgi:putative endonuclease